jgi:phenylacetate-CoA ligase
LVDTYGFTEVGNIALECPDEHAGYQLNADSVFVEFIKDGETVSGGEEGEIVWTELTNTATPFIRYRIGDMGVPSDGLCSCERTLR